MKANYFLKRFKNIPIGCTGVAVGIGGLGSLWTAILHFASPKVDLAIVSIIQYFCISITILFLTLIILRNISHKGTFSEELKHPLLASYLPTIFMSTMIIAGFIGHIGDLCENNQTAHDAFKGIGVIIWYFAIIGHFIVFILFIINVIRKHNIKTDSLYASWFVPPVGIIVSCTVAGSLNNGWIPNELFQAIWYFGVTLYLIFLPIISYKLIFHRSNDKNTFPSIAIFGAPANLSLVGFLSIFIKKDGNQYEIVKPQVYSWEFINTIFTILLFLGVLSTLVIYLLLPRIFSVKFNPTYASLTFPLAVGATSTFKAFLYLWTNYYDKSEFTKTLTMIIFILSMIEFVIANLMIIYVFSRYVILISRQLFPKQNKEINLN